MKGTVGVSDLQVCRSENSLQAVTNVIFRKMDETKTTMNYILQ